MTAALALAIPARVQQHSKSRFGWAVAQERKSMLQWVVLPAGCGCSMHSAWDCMGRRRGFGGHLSMKEGLHSFCLV